MEKGRAERGGDGVRSFFIAAAATAAAAVVVFLRFGSVIMAGCGRAEGGDIAGIVGSALMSSEGSGGMYGGGGDGLELRHSWRKSEGLMELGMNAGHVMRERSGSDSWSL